MTYTYALLEVSDAAYDEIAAKLREAGYDHAFGAEGEIDMHGLALVKAKPAEPPAPTPFDAWMAELGAEVDRRHIEHRGAYARLDYAEWRHNFDQGLTPAEALQADLERRFRPILKDPPKIVDLGPETV